MKRDSITETIAALRDRLGESVTRTAARQFMGSVNKHLRVITEVESHPKDDRLRAAHSLKSAAALVGANHLSDLAGSMETRLHGGHEPMPAEADVIEPLRAAAQQAMARVQELVDAW